MAITVKVQSGTPVIAVKQLNTGLQATNPVTVSSSLNVNKLENLADVVSSGKQDGDTLVYQANNQKYVVEPLDIKNTIGNFDGGSF